MKTFTKPLNLNGAELISQLLSVGIKVDRITQNTPDTISFETDNEELAVSVIEKHNGTTVAPQLTVADKLASVGLSIDELRVVLTEAKEII